MARQSAEPTSHTLATALKLGEAATDIRGFCLVKRPSVEAFSQRMKSMAAESIRSAHAN